MPPGASGFTIKFNDTARDPLLLPACQFGVYNQVNDTASDPSPIARTYREDRGDGRGERICVFLKKKRHQHAFFVMSPCWLKFRHLVYNSIITLPLYLTSQYPRMTFGYYKIGLFIIQSIRSESVYPNNAF